MAKRVYRKYHVSLPYRVTHVDLVEFVMLLLTVEPEWLSFSFQIPRPGVESGNFMPKGQFVSCLKARKMISNGCIYHLVRVRDRHFEIHILESYPVVNELTGVFLDDLLNIPPEREIDFGIYLLPVM
ncbi:hypothetical protein MTR67_030804 [Solanum verrucosum]|uniref:Uncharacterized protein n=1 Tax=Solanum verrucosum TaxID=315347 RepID=A0AAF0U1A7_SOLVR|nr:hypothetical protein MTR67_030804 [Solanum verrucosum]